MRSLARCALLAGASLLPLAVSACAPFPARGMAGRARPTWPGTAMPEPAEDPGAVQATIESSVPVDPGEFTGPTPRRTKHPPNAKPGKLTPGYGG